MTHTFTFEDRSAAGRLLGRRLEDYAGRDDVLVLALPPGGVLVAYEVAEHLHVSLDVLVIRKLEVPGHPELAMGTIVSSGARYLHKEVLRQVHVTRNQFDVVFNCEFLEMKRRERIYRDKRGPLNVANRIVIVVDDGTTAQDILIPAMKALRAEHPASIVVAVPVASSDAARHVLAAADEFECVYTAHDFHSAGQFYQRFDDVDDTVVHDLLAQTAIH